MAALESPERPADAGPKLEMQVDAAERVLRVPHPLKADAELLVHEWYQWSFGRWSACCHPRPAAEGVEGIRKNCARFSQISKILFYEGERGVRRSIIHRDE